LDTLGVLQCPDALPENTTLLLEAQACFKGLRKTIRLLICHARRLRRANYGKALLRLFVKKPSAALKSILRSSEEKSDTTTLPTDLSVLRNESTGQILTSPNEVIEHLTQLETTALSPDPTLPMGVPFPWLTHVSPSPTSVDPMLIGKITPAIFQEALRRTPNHKAAGPDGVPGIVLKHMPTAFHEAILLLF
jgi:hypothetical protein